MFFVNEKPITAYIIVNLRAPTYRVWCVKGRNYTSPFYTLVAS